MCSQHFCRGLCGEVVKSFPTVRLGLVGYKSMQASNEDFNLGFLYSENSFVYHPSSVQLWM